jgi:hypothetical protein
MMADIYSKQKLLPTEIAAGVRFLKSWTVRTLEMLA